MATSLYTKALQRFLGADIDLENDDIKVVAVDTADYTFSISHEFLSDVAAGARVATSGNLQNPTITDGVFDADNITINSVTGDTVEALIVYKDTGVAGTSPLILYIDTGTGFPFTPNGGNLTINWSDGANKIFKLTA